MKQNLKAVGGYIANFTKVCFLAPILFAKVITDTGLQLLLALIHALFNEKEEIASAMKTVLDKMD
jgi:hypothetical protein|nr:MAG TPA: hypothetical protein [Caudoviricetes sp.]